MRKIKDSGVEWLGIIPETWDLVQLGSLFSEHKNKNTGMQSTNLLSMSYGNIIRKDINTSDGLLPDSFEGYNVIDDGDIVLRLTDLQNDQRSLRVGLSHERGIVTSAYVTLRKRNPAMNSQFFYYLIHSYDMRKGFYGMGAGVRQGLNFAGVRKIMMTLPSADEQKTIADFLENKNAQVDTLITNVQAQIEKLKAYKQSLITEIVTKGLETAVPMKDSGVEWIGDVPSHWTVIRLKHLYDHSNGSPVRVGPFGSALPSSELTDEGTWVYTQRTVLDHNFETNNTFVSPKKADELSGFAVYPKDILVTTRGSIGKTAIVPDGAPRGILHPCVIRFRINGKKMNNALLSCIFNETNICLGQIMDMSNSTTIEVLYSYSLKEIWVPCPPIEEQEAIYMRICELMQKFDRLIAIKQSKIEKLEQYKRSLIYEYVTGKKEVPAHT